MSFFRNWFYLYVKSPPAERAFENLICTIGEPYRAQYPFPGLKRVADFVLPTRKVVIEVDGASHLALEQRRKDLVSTIALEKAGWKVIRFTNDEVLGWVEHPISLGEIIDSRLATRPTLGELEAALALLPEPVGKQSKRRARKPKPAPK